MSSAETVTTYRAGDRAGLTLGDLLQFAQQAIDAGADPREVVRVMVGWKGQALAITTGPRHPFL
ncbi:hypothetical protein CIK84_08775 [Glutamicibacter arilaitensis]|uniref:Uncharacterized protein n=1 Tax=Glutamicibacter arilaitensis TaxID=256701 RepID=A0A2N7S639_9MICC|nr:hypothetical protein CIK84_08775 [Glutamicibacter arilaitensis]